MTEDFDELVKKHVIPHMVDEIIHMIHPDSDFLMCCPDGICHGSDNRNHVSCEDCLNILKGLVRDKIMKLSQAMSIQEFSQWKDSIPKELNHCLSFELWGFKQDWDAVYMGEKCLGTFPEPLHLLKRIPDLIKESEVRKKNEEDHYFSFRVHVIFEYKESPVQISEEHFRSPYEHLPGFMSVNHGA